MVATTLGCTPAVLSEPCLNMTADGPWIIGELFQGATRVRPNDRPAIAEKLSPAALLSRFWGRYVAVSQPSPDCVLILRDPSAALPCYYWRQDGLTLVASDLELLERASLRPARLHWPEIARILGAGDLRAPSTAIEGMLELPAGSELDITGGRITTTGRWSPWQHAGRDPRIPFDELAQTLRSRVEIVMAALGAAQPGVLATVSGGLDSSIVALTLASIVPSLTCLTLATDEPSGDERRYARLVTEVASATYCERLFDTSAVDLQRSQTAHLPRPVGRPFFQCVETIVSDVARAHGVRTVFGGTGGDNVFCSLQSATPVVDLLLACRPRQAARTLVDVAVLTNASYLEVALAALRRWTRARSPYQWRDDRRFLSPTQAAVASRFVHPWLCAPPGARPGQVAHVAMLLRVQNYLEPWSASNALESVDPLLAQPIVECCLAIPSWQWCRGGVDRAVARRAFSDRLPAAIQRRRWKGGPDSFVGKLVDDRRPLIRSLLLDGALNGQGLLDGAAIAEVLDDPKPPSAGDALRLLALTDAEAWVRLRC